MPIPPNERARRCDDCGAMHRPDVDCPPVGRWLISGEPVAGLAPKRPDSAGKQR